MTAETVVGSSLDGQRHATSLTAEASHIAEDIPHAIMS
jgi:hypothetical protein